MRSLFSMLLVLAAAVCWPLAAEAGNSVYIDQVIGNVIGAAFDGLPGIGGHAPSSNLSLPLHAPAVGSVVVGHQYGNNNTANLDVHSGNAAWAEQHGADNTTSIDAGGSGNSIAAVQVGNGNTSNLSTSGSGNVLLQAQLGSYNSADLALTGNHTILIQTQVGNGLHFDLSQLGQLPSGLVIIKQTRNH